MDKKQREKLKKQLKKQLTSIIGDSLACRAMYHEDKQSWEVWLLNDYEIPTGLEVVKVNMDEDAKQEAVVFFMKQKEEELIRLLSDYFKVENKGENIQDFNFTVTFPPMCSTIFNDGKYRLKTEEEKKELIKRRPYYAEYFKADEKIFEAGYYEFLGSEGPIEHEGFVLRKYAGLRAKYHLLLTEKAVNEEV